MMSKITLYLPEHWKRTTKKQRDAQAKDDAFADMVEALVAQGWGDGASEEAQVLMRLSKLLTTDE